MNDDDLINLALDWLAEARVADLMIDKGWTISQALEVQHDAGALLQKRTAP